MKHKKVLLASLLAVSGLAGQSAYAAVNWSGTANYTVAPGAQLDEEALAPSTPMTWGRRRAAEKYRRHKLQRVYQSYVTNHELASVPVLAAKLNNTYELTMVANFTETVTLLVGEPPSLTSRGYFQSVF